VATVTVRGDASGATVELIVTHDALAYALNDTSARVTDPQMYALLEGPRADLGAALQDGRERFQAGFKVFADGELIDLEIVRAPSLDLMDRWLEDNPSRRLPVKLDFIARTGIPVGARTVSFRAPAVFGQVILGVARQGHETSFMPLEPGETSPTYDVSVVTAPPDGAGTPPPAAHAASEPGVFGVAWRYVVLGYWHIIPQGRDHELFILGLFLLNSRFKNLVWQTTTFSLAHTCSLTLAALGLVNIPSGVVEPVIAATIAFIAIENLVVTRIHPWRPAVGSTSGWRTGWASRPGC